MTHSFYAFACQDSCIEKFTHSSSRFIPNGCSTYIKPFEWYTINQSEKMARTHIHTVFYVHHANKITNQAFLRQFLSLHLSVNDELSPRSSKPMGECIITYTCQVVRNINGASNCNCNLFLFLPSSSPLSLVWMKSKS